MRITCFLHSSLRHPGNCLDTQSRTKDDDEEEYDNENETLHRCLPELLPIGLGLGVCDNFHDEASEGFIAARPARLLITASNSVGSTGFAK